MSLRSQHQNILQFLGYQVIDKSIVLVSPFCHNGSIEHHLKENPMLTRNEKLRYVSEDIVSIASGEILDILHPAI